MSNAIVISKSPPINSINWLILFILSILWGGSFFFSGLAVKELPVLTIVFGRVSIAALALFIFLRIRKRPFPTDIATLKAFLVIGFLNNLVPFTLIVAGQVYIGSGLASILNATTPLFTAVVAHIASKEASERLTMSRIVGIIFGIAGVAIMLSPAVDSGYGFSDSAVIGQIAILGAAFSYGLAAVYGRRFAKQGIPPAVSATGQVSATSLLLLPFVFFIDEPWTFIGSISATTLWAVVALALFSTSIAYILYFQLIKNIGSTNASLVTLIIPVSAVILGVLFLNEVITVHSVIGMGCISAGLLVIDGRVFRCFKQKKPGDLPG